MLPRVAVPAVIANVKTWLTSRIYSIIPLKEVITTIVLSSFTDTLALCATGRIIHRYYIRRNCRRRRLEIRASHLRGPRCPADGIKKLTRLSIGKVRIQGHNPHWFPLSARSLPPHPPTAIKVNV